jgi:hypothetical protein
MLKDIASLPVPGQYRNFGTADLAILDIQDTSCLPDPDLHYDYLVRVKETGFSQLSPIQYPTKDEALDAAIEGGFTPSWLGIIIVEFP